MIVGNFSVNFDLKKDTAAVAIKRLGNYQFKIIQCN